MLNYLVRRLLRLVLSLIAVSIVTFGLLQMVPGTFSDLANVGTTALSDEAVESEGISGRYGDDVPAWKQYVTFMEGVATWDMGPTFKYPHMTVEELIADHFPVSLSLAVPAMILTLLVAVPAGLLAAVRKDTIADHGSMFILTTIQALPGYLFAVLLILIFSVGLGWLPVRGWSGPEHLIIPVVALAVQPIAMLARYVRSSMLESLREDYVVAAMAKGGTRRVVLVRHVLRNSLIPLVTVVGPVFAALATGTVFVEVLLGIPGLGRLFTLAARTRDMPLLMGTTLFFALILMLINLIVDLVYGLLDPRIRHQQRTSLRWRRPSHGRQLQPAPPPRRPDGGPDPTLVVARGEAL
jgi:ABC-type dipeptide/oligopeptide/nickel transport system permease component